MYKNIKINGIENYYYANELGEIYSMFSGRMKQLKPCTHKLGYKYVSLSRSGCKGGRSLSVHRLVYSAFNGDIKENFTINHIDGDKSNNNLSNLEMIPWFENVQHSVDNKLVKIHKGDSHPSSKYSDDELIDGILEIILRGKGKQTVSKEFGLDNGYFSKVFNGKAKKHLWENDRLSKYNRLDYIGENKTINKTIPKMTIEQLIEYSNRLKNGEFNCNLCIEYDVDEGYFNKHKYKISQFL